jgi:SPP1 family predicted phage head-tail adaptor
MAIARIRAGQLDQVIDILAPTLVQDSFGGTVIEQYTVVVSRERAFIESLTGRELYQAQQAVDQVTHRITIRWRSGIRENYNVRWRGDGGAEYDRFFQVQNILNPDQMQHVMVLVCLERADSTREEQAP